MKDKFDILNDVKIDIDEYKEIKFDNNDEFKSKMKSKLRNKKYPYKKSIAIASMALILGGGFLFTDKGWAQIKHLWYTIDEVLNMKNEEIEGYKYNINKTVEDKDIKVTFKNIMLDNDNIVIDLNIDDTKFNPYSYYTKEEQEKYSVDKWANIKTRVELDAEGVQVYVDGQKMRYKSSVMSPNSNERKEDNTTDLISYQSIGAIGKENDEYYIEEIPKDKFPYVVDENKVYKFKLKVRKIYIGQSEYTEEDAKKQNGRYGTAVYGDWSIDVDINGKDLLNQSLKYDINKIFILNLEEGEVRVDLNSINISPIKISLDYNIDEIEENFEFTIFNDKGEKYQLESISGSTDVMSYYGNIFKDTEYIKIVPVIKDFKNKKTLKFEDKAIKVPIKEIKADNSIK